MQASDKDQYRQANGADAPVAHTAGPWVICVEDGEDKAYTVFAESQLKNGRIEAEEWDDRVAHAGLNWPNCEANARLIAASPSLLAALKACLWCMESDLPPEVTEAERLAAAAAIALATGAPA